MTKRRMMTKLLVVVAFAGCEEIAPPAPVVTTPTAPAPTSKTTPSPPPAPAADSTAGMAAATPRTTPEGRPACGNVASRSAKGMTRNCKPRVLPDGRPAPGNVAKRTPAPVEDQ